MPYDGLGFGLVAGIHSSSYYEGGSPPGEYATKKHAVPGLLRPAGPRLGPANSDIAFQGKTAHTKAPSRASG